MKHMTMRIALPCAMLIVAFSFAGCGNGEENSGGIQQGQSAKVKSPQSNESYFNKRPGAGSKNLGMAYQDGFTAGRNASSDFNMNWMKNWDKDADWRTEYDRGWKDGRNLRRMQDERAKGSPPKVT